MEILIAATSILAITVFVWIANKILPFKVCPICAGVSGTWLWIIAGLYLGWLMGENWRLIAGIAMGGSIVGIAYQLEKKILNPKLLLPWKALFIPAGFIAVYSISMRQLAIALLALIFLVLVAILFLSSAGPKSELDKTRWEELKNKMKKCC